MMSVILSFGLDILIFLLSKLPDAFMGWGVGKVLDNLISTKFSRSKKQNVMLYSLECGDAGINLEQQRLLVSTAFGNYFTGLLEKENLYLDLESQIDCPPVKGQEGLKPLQRLYWLLSYPKSPRIFVFAGDGGMGKSTLSAKIVRCLFQEGAIDTILGDSAKTQHIDPISGEVVKFQPGYYDVNSFYKRLCHQLGLPPLSKKQAIIAIKDRLVGQKAIIVVDNLEAIEKGNELLDSLRILTSRDIRAIVTTRETKKLRPLLTDLVIVQLKPITSPKDAKQFVEWHIEQYKVQNPTLASLKTQLSQNNLKWLIEKTGGIPLLLQLISTDVARTSWEHAKGLPNIFGKELLEFLYRARWDDLGNQGVSGDSAKRVLKWITAEQYRGKGITTKRIKNWAEDNSLSDTLDSALLLLHERFMVVNRDVKKGDYSIFPSLAEFIERQSV
ncbi:MAG: hypothetical protein DDG60_04510 [Anaerolineae bacterium]|nr:MAG: hypothetical protein DDG60_04510 [Anaerolineae bacterium]